MFSSVILLEIISLIRTYKLRRTVIYNCTQSRSREQSLTHLAACLMSGVPLPSWSVIQWFISDNQIYLVLAPPISQDHHQMQRQIPTTLSFSVVPLIITLLLGSCITGSKTRDTVLLIFFKTLKKFFWPCHTTYGILVPWPGIKPLPPAVEAWSLNHWTTREVPADF